MKFYGLLGEKLSHSLSEPIHRMFFEETGIEGAYKLVEVAPDRLGDAVAAMRLLGFSGSNVTIPYKRAVIPFLTDVHSRASRMESVNTLHFDGAETRGYSTDPDGFSALLRREEIEVSGKVCAVLGATGGAARSLTEAFLEGGAKEILLVSRHPEGENVPDPRCCWLTYAQLMERETDILANATPVGMYPKAGVSPVPMEVVRRTRAVVDTIYNPAQTELMRMAEEAGIKNCNGLYMLVAQAMRSQEIWQGMPVERELTDRIYARLRLQWEGRT